MLIEASLLEADRAFLAEVRRFLDSELDSKLVAADDAQRMFFGDFHRANAWLETLKARRWHVGHWPQARGGAGLTRLQNYLLLYEQGLRGAPVIRPFGVNYVGLTLMKFGTPEQQAELLPRIVDNTEHWCQGFSEPGAGSDLGNVATFAERRGDAYVINGSKIWTTDAHYADKIFCLVRTRRENSKDALSFVLVDMKSPGVTVQPIRLLAGDHEVNQVFLDDVEITPDRLLGPEGGGWAVAKYLLEIERGAFVFGGRLRRRFERVVGDAKRRGASSRFWDAAARLDIDLMAYEWTELRLGHLESGREGTLCAANIIKIEWTEILQRIDELALTYTGSEALYASTLPSTHVYGENGEIEMPEWLASHLNNRAATIYGGSNEIQRNLIYRGLRQTWG